MSELAKFIPRTISGVNRSGKFKVREVFEPTEETAREHLEILKLFETLGISMHMPYATGSVVGKDALDNVRPHCENDYFYITDLRDAFPSVDIDTLIQIIRSPIIPLAQQERIVKFIVDYGTEFSAPGLPLGAPASPLLFNIYCLPMDRQIGQYCDSEGDIVYTRYLDDLTFSSKKKIGKKRRAVLRNIIESHPGMNISHPKSRVLDIKDGPITITGTSIYCHADGSRRLSPSPQIMDDARLCFEAILAKISEGDDVSESDIGRLHGYHGALVQRSEGPQTERFRNALSLYQKALGKLGTSSVSDKNVPWQFTLFE